MLLIVLALYGAKSTYVLFCPLLFPHISTGGVCSLSVNEIPRHTSHTASRRPALYLVSYEVYYGEFLHSILHRYICTVYEVPRTST